MGLLDALAGRTKILDFAIVVSDDEVAVSVTPVVSPISPDDYVRLWLWYECNLIFGYGGTGTDRGAVALETVSALAAAAEDFGLDSFEHVGCRGVRLTTSVRSATYRVTGTYYSRGDERRIAVNFPFGGQAEKDLSAVGLFEWTRLAQGIGHKGPALLAASCRALYDEILVKEVSAFQAAERAYAQARLGSGLER